MPAPTSCLRVVTPPGNGNRRSGAGCLAAWILATGVAWTADPPGASPDQPPADAAPLRVSRHQAVFTAPPTQIPCDAAVDAPLMGNGDTLVAMGGDAERLRFFINTNDLWELRPSGGSPRPLGRIDCAFPELHGASYRVEQDLATAVTSGRFTLDGRELALESGVMATENLLWIRLEALQGTLHGSARLAGAGDGPEKALPADGRKVVDPRGREAVEEAGIQVLERRFDQGVRVATGAACALRNLDGGGEFLLEPGRPVVLVAAIDSLLKDPDFRATARRRVAAIDAARLAVLRTEHRAWWRRFWSASFVELPDQRLEQRYYLSHYVLASASRDPEFPPGLFGWVTTDHPRWGGCYFLNYNFVAPFYGLYAANHLEQAAPCSRPFVHVAARTEQDASVRTGDIAGIYQSRTIAPLGCFGAAGRPYAEGGRSPEQKSNGAYSCVPLALHWYLGCDPDYARQVYPYVRGVATFWEHWLRFEQGVYNDHADPVHEESGDDLNPIHSLALIRLVMDLAIDLGRELAVDGDRRDTWRNIRDHLAPYPQCTVRDLPPASRPRHLPLDDATLDLPIFRYTGRGTPWWPDNTLGIQHIFPAGGLGLDSAPGLLQRARNQITVMDRWVDFNGMNSFYAAAARVGYDPRTILTRMGGMVERLGLPNGMIRGNPHGMEHQSIVPNAIQEMLMQSHEGVLRLFPCWPRDLDARFGTLRARGAFLVSAELQDGIIGGVAIVSERGRDLTVANPWPGRAVRVRRADRPETVIAGERFTIATAPGETLILTPCVPEPR